MNSFNSRKTVKKSTCYWRHGKHSNAAEIALMINNQDKKRPKQKMYATVQEAMAAESKQ